MQIYEELQADGYHLIVQDTPSNDNAYRTFGYVCSVNVYY